MKEKKQRKQRFPNPENKPQEGSSNTKSTEEKINGDPKAPNMATSSSSRLELVPEKLKNYFSEPDEHYLSSRKRVIFLMQKNWKRNNGIKKKSKFILSIVWWSITMFISEIAANFCFVIKLYQFIRLRFWQHRINKDLFSVSQYRLW